MTTLEELIEEKPKNEEEGCLWLITDLVKFFIAVLVKAMQMLTILSILMLFIFDRHNPQSVEYVIYGIFFQLAWMNIRKEEGYKL